MFWDKWIPKKYLVKSEICAVEISFTDEGTMYHHTCLRNKGAKLEVVETGSGEGSLALPGMVLKNKIPLVLIVNGKGVILKKISLGENSEQSLEEIIRQNLPAINAADFYVQVYRQSDLSAFLAFCRREQVDALITDLKSKKYDMAAILLGAPAVTGLEPLWSNHNSISTSLHRIELTNGAVDSIIPEQQTSTEPVRFDDLAFPARYTLGFAAGLGYLMQRTLSESNAPELSALALHHQEKNKFRLLMLLVVGIAFLLAVVNVVFYTSYFDKNNKLETELSVYQGKYEQINELLSDYQKNKDLIENAGVLHKNKLSEYADRIGKTLPDEVVLSELYFNPKKDDEESLDSLVTFRNKNLVLRGNCPKSFIVNEWINVLKMQKFIKDVSLEKFVYSNEGLLPNFEIRLVTE